MSSWLIQHLDTLTQVVKNMATLLLCAISFLSKKLTRFFNIINTTRLDSMVLRLAFLVILTVCVPNAQAQWVLLKTDADKLVRDGTRYIYNVQFDSASICFNKVIQLYPEHPAGYFLDAMIEWWKIQIDRRNKSYEEVFLTKIDRVIGVCDAILEKEKFDIAGLFFKGGALGFRGRYYASNQSWLKAANDGRDAFDILMQCSKLAPANADIRLGTGIYNYFAAALPEQYPALKAVMVFLPNGEKKVGISQLESAAQKAVYAAVEAKVVLQQVYSNQFENSPHDYLRICRELYTAYPNNPVFHRKYATALLQTGNLDTSDYHWHQILANYRTKKFGYDAFSARDALYYIGWYLFQQGKYNESLPYFYKCDEASRYLDEDPSGFMIKLNLYIGKVYDIQGKRDLAISQYKKILSWRDNKGSHSEAEQLMQKPYGK